MKNIFSDKVLIDDLDIATKLIEECRNGFLKLFNSSPVCMSLTTLRERTYVQINAKFLEKFGYAKEAVIGRTSIEVGILDENESKRVARIIKEAGKLQNEIVTCITKAGEIVYTVSSIELIELNGEQYLMSSFLDITKMIEQQKIIEEQHKNIVDSMNYARLIQNSILPSPKQILDILPESFVLNKPKDIVSGDFFWIKEHQNKIFVAACDCTGHGTPGALISVIGYKLLNKFINEYHISTPADILNQLNKEFNCSDTCISDTNVLKDGMDISICTIDRSTMIMEYAGASNPIYMVRKGELQQLTVDKIAIHLFTNSSEKTFTNYSVQIEKGDQIYLFSDGYADQFGGPFGKKFMRKQFQKLLLSIQNRTMLEQKEILDRTIEDWKNAAGEEQTDDILVVGFKIS